jgi:hypothetical protein
LSRNIRALDTAANKRNNRQELLSQRLERHEQLSLNRSIDAARDELLNRQTEQGYWLFELEADCTIPAEYIMMMHYLDEIDSSLERQNRGVSARAPGRPRRLAAVLRRRAQHQLHR